MAEALKRKCDRCGCEVAAARPYDLCVECDEILEANANKFVLPKPEQS